ncbi:uncharacterized protein LOC114956987, partial [Acropora millepora]|uniref:uncharacterized protein LOC114956987 n=1 Tax=Acropora millepora TaxID=45264 RepID=UPI001CF488E2
MEGTVVVGCPDTPGKGSRYCHIHSGFARQFQDDNIEDTIDKSKTAHNSEELLVVKILNEKSTRKTKMYEVLWSDGRKSWLRDVHLPKKVEEIVHSQKDYTLHLLDVVEFGQRRSELQLLTGKRTENDGFPVGQSIVSSSGFAIENVDDCLVQDSSGKKRQLVCGTEKGKHKCKNYRTAGILVMERPCGIVINVNELFGSESKSQVYAHIHNLLEKPQFDQTSVICYDDACHLKRFAQNPIRCSKTDIASRSCEMEILCDRFYFKNHVDGWCRTYCNPLKSETLKFFTSLLSIKSEKLFQSHRSSLRMQTARYPCRQLNSKTIKSAALCYLRLVFLGKCSIISAKCVCKVEEEGFENARNSVCRTRNVCDRALRGMKNVTFFFSAISAQSLKKQTKKKKADEDFDEESDDNEQMSDSSQVASSSSQEWITNHPTIVNQKLCPSVTYWIALTTPNGAPCSPILIHRALLKCSVDVLANQVGKTLLARAKLSKNPLRQRLHLLLELLYGECDARMRQ